MSSIFRYLTRRYSQCSAIFLSLLPMKKVGRYFESFRSLSKEEGRYFVICLPPLPLKEVGRYFVSFRSHDLDIMQMSI